LQHCIAFLVGKGSKKKDMTGGAGETKNVDVIPKSLKVIKPA
jgi:hypothetical protein